MNECNISACEGEGRGLRRAAGLWAKRQSRRFVRLREKRHFLLVMGRLRVSHPHGAGDRASPRRGALNKGPKCPSGEFIQQ